MKGYCSPVTLAGVFIKRDEGVLFPFIPVTGVVIEREMKGYCTPVTWVYREMKGYCTPVTWVIILIQ